MTTSPSSFTKHGIPIVPLSRTFAKAGFLCFEFGMGQGDAVCALLEENGYTILERSRDYNDRERAVIAQLTRKEA